MVTTTNNNSSIGAGGALNLIPVKVMSVILDINHELAERSGGFDSIGTIFYIKVSDTKNNPSLENPEDGQSIADMKTAKPLFANQKIYPLKGEVVLLLSGTGRDIDEDLRQAYYLPNTNIWNSIHHNAIPNVEAYLDKEEVKNDYPETTGGIIRTVTDGSTDIPLGGYFNERLNTKPLLPYEGDMILEGRFGNSIRFGSTNISKKIPDASKNPWSSIGVVGDPITIIRNGQNPDEGVEGWIPTIENINKDDSSIYLTYNQKIDNLQVASNFWASWEAVVEIPNDTNNLSNLTNTEVVLADTEPETVEVEKTIIAAEKEELQKEETEETNVVEEEKIEPVVVTTTVEEEIGMLDELLESGDFTEEDFEWFETEIATDIPIAIDYQPEISATDNEVLIEIAETKPSTYRENGVLDTEMLIGKYFKLSQLIYSGTAKRKGWSNIPGQDVKKKSQWTEEYIIRNLENLMTNVGDKLYEKWPKMNITSGYRAKILNDSLGSSDSSHHPQGCAIDLQIPGVKTSEITNWIIDNIPTYAQVIWEKPESRGSWVHIAYKSGDKRRKTDVYTAQENILAHYGNKRRGRGKTKYMNIDRAKQNLV